MAQQFNSPNRGSGFRGPREETDSYTRSSESFDLKQYEPQIIDWVRNEINKATIDFADKFGKYVAENDLTTSQIRTVFGEMKRIQMNEYVSEKTNFLLLKPKLAYAVKRHNKSGLKAFFEFFKISYGVVDTVNDENGKKHFANMMQIMEAVLAYHKYHGGKE